jgi:iron complex outermembrane recepter protein
MIRRHRLLGFLASVSASILAQSAAEASDQTFQFDIQAQELDPALRAFAEVSKQQVAFDARSVQGRRSTALKGEFVPLQALVKMLAGSGLSAQAGASGLLMVRDTKKLSSRRSDVVRLAQLQTPSSDQSPSVGGPREDEGSVSLVEEIVVTAQKRLERLRDVPVPVTAVQADELASSGQLRLQDYYSRIPGVSLTVGDGRGLPMLSIRGITSGYTNPTVGVVIDDAPFGASTNNALGAMVPDLDPSELARVEVLRGPQGTLYGASSMGGLFKYVTVDPSMDRFGGQVQGGLGSVRNGDDVGYNVSGSVNVPLGDTFAVRVHAFHRRDPGYIDDPVRDAESINSATFEGGRIAALWRPSDAVSLKVSALLQESRNDGLSRVDRQPGFSDLQQSSLEGTGWLDKRVAAYTAHMTAQLPWAELVSISSYGQNRFTDGIDVTPAFGALTESVFGVQGTGLFDFIETRKLSQELRLTIPLGKRLDWLIGGFYTDEDSELRQLLLAKDDAGGTVGTWLDGDNPSSFDELAAFTNLTVRFTDRFDLQLGGRHSHIGQTSSGISRGALVGGESIATPTDIADDVFTYLVTPRVLLSRDVMAYARFASGYRGGLPNSNLVTGVPVASSPDKTRTYEVGLKGSVLEGRVSFDASLYRIDWLGIQMQIVNSGVGYFTNGSDARSEGVELSVDSQPLPGLTVGGWVAWGAAELVEDFPAGSSSYGKSGDRLPYSTRMSGNLSVQKDFPLPGGLTGFAAGAWSYVGDRVGYFTATQTRQPLSSYSKTDLRLGIRGEVWSANLLVNNLTDERGELTGGIDSTPVVGYTYIQPRTIGLTFTRTF